MGTQNCPFCGNTLPAEARFCNQCGKALSGGTLPLSSKTSEPVVKLSADPMKPWWITFGVVLFISLFIPLGLDGGKLKMFWDCFNFDASYGAWLIVNAVLGIAMFVITLIFHRGIARGCVMAGAGLVGFILYISLMKGMPAYITLFTLGLISLGVVLGSSILRQNKPASLTATITGAISGGVTTVLFLIGIILLLIKTGGHWTTIVNNILGGVFNVLPIVAGIISLAIVGKPKELSKLLKGIMILVWIYLGCLVLWYLLQIILPAISFGGPIEQILLGVLPIVVSLLCWIIYLLSLGFGFVEILL